MSELEAVGPYDNPTACLMVKHVSKKLFIAKWQQEWEGELPKEEEIQYQYGVPQVDGTWVLNQDVSLPGALAVTVFQW